MSPKKSIELNTIFERLPGALVQQFARIACYYVGFIDSSTKEVDRAEYINETTNAIGVIAKLTALASDGHIHITNEIISGMHGNIALQKAIIYYNTHNNHKIDERKSAIQVKASKKKIESDSIDPQTIINNELKLWGIHKTSYAYTAISDIPRVCSKGMTPREAFSAIGKNNNINAGITANAIRCAVANAAFDQSEFFTIFKTTNRNDIDKEFFVSTIIEQLCK